jgi:hypothetical protein
VNGTLVSSSRVVADRGRTGLATALVVVVVLLALAGAVVSAGMLLDSGDGGGGTASVRAGSPRVGDEVPISYGVIAVEHVEQTEGLSPQDLAGQTHGIQNLVEQGAKQVQAAITLTNTSNVPVDYSIDQFRIRAGGKLLPPMASSITDGRLQPSAAIDLRINFAVPANGSRLALQFRDAGGDDVLIALGQVGKSSPAPAGTGHDAGHGG